MRILAIAEFDPAGVLSGHRAALRKLDVDYRLFIHDIYGIPVQPDWIRVDDDLLKFLEEADVLQLHPAIGQPWSYVSREPRFDYGEDKPFVDLAKHAKKLVLFHGSRNADANAESYAEYWRHRNVAIWATTVDYAYRMLARLAPPSVNLVPRMRAALRSDNDPLIVAHAPTDPENCQTDLFLATCKNYQAVAELIFKRPHAEVISRKSRCNAGFDHLRGAFSVNTIENCALGLAPLAALKQHYRVLLSDMTTEEELRALFPFKDAEGFQDYFEELSYNPERTRQAQERAYAWYQRCWRPEVIGLRLKKMYEEL